MNSFFGKAAPKLIFMGTPDFSVSALKALYKAGYDIVAVYSQPPKPVGRGYKLTASAVQQYAESVGLSVFTPKSLRKTDIQEQFRAHQADLAVVVAYGLILPAEVLQAPIHGCLNIHASLLPRWRGAAPIQRSIMAGDSETGITIMKMDEGLDTGPMLTQGKIMIDPDTTAGTLHDQMGSLGAALILETIPGYLAGTIKEQEQPSQGITYAHKLSKLESPLDWRRSAHELDCHIRGLTPWPGATLTHGDHILKIGQVQVIDGIFDHEPGYVLDDQLTIVCAQGALRLKTIQKPGSKWLSTDEFLRGYSLPKGTQLPCPVTN